MNIEPLLISLCVLSKINVNDKIYINRYGRIALHQDTTMTAIYRTVFGESRDKSLNYVNDIINDTIEKIYTYYKDSSDNSTSEYYMYQLIKSLNKSISGLENMKITYKDDLYTVSYFESIIDRINFHNKLFNSVIDNIDENSIIIS